MDEDDEVKTVKTDLSESKGRIRTSVSNFGVVMGYKLHEMLLFMFSGQEE